MSNREDFEPRETTDELAELFATYRQAIPDPEASADFMPRLWERIDARQTFASGFKHFAERIVTVAALASLVMGVLLAVPRHSTSPYYTHTYLELLAASQDRESVGDATVVEAVHEGAR